MYINIFMCTYDERDSYNTICSRNVWRLGAGMHNLGQDSNTKQALEIRLQGTSDVFWWEKATQIRCLLTILHASCVDCFCSFKASICDIPHQNNLEVLSLHMLTGMPDGCHVSLQTVAMDAISSPTTGLKYLGWEQPSGPMLSESVVPHCWKSTLAPVVHLHLKDLVASCKKQERREKR